MSVQRFSIQDKKDVLTILHSGVSKNLIARLLGIDKKEITIWDLRFQHYGQKGLAPLGRRRFPEEYKKQVVGEYLLGNISMRELCARQGVSLSTLKNWLHQYNAAPQS